MIPQIKLEPKDKHDLFVILAQRWNERCKAQGLHPGTREESQRESEFFIGAVATLDAFAQDDKNSQIPPAILFGTMRGERLTDHYLGRASYVRLQFESEGHIICDLDGNVVERVSDDDYERHEMHRYRKFNVSDIVEKAAEDGKTSIWGFYEEQPVCSKVEIEEFDERNPVY